MLDKDIILYGAGTQNLRLAYQMIDAAGLSIRYIVDRDRAKQGKRFWGTEIISPEKLVEFDDTAEEYILVITVRTESTIQEIKESLKGLHRADVFTFEEIVIKEKLNSKFIKLNQMQTHVTDHCNLNCVRCSHFAPIAKEFYLDAEEFEKSVKRLSELLHGELHEYQLAGGEPLLHPQCYKFPYIVRKYFPKTNIILITNGTLLCNMENSFFQSCRDNDLQLWITVYPIGLNFDAIREKLENERINFVIGNSGVEGGSEKEMWGLAYHLNGDRSGEKDFEECFSRCFMLRGSKVYICTQGAYADILNDHFGLTLPQLKENGVDIFEVSDSGELMGRLAKKIPFCDYCNPFHRQPPVPFGISKREITEWVDTSES